MVKQRTKARPGRVRIQRFKAALAIREQTMEQWADSRGVSYGHLWQVLNERRVSAPLIAKVEQFTHEVLTEAQPAAASA
jgi:hypothetical protein